MELILASAGSYPRIGDSPGQQGLRRAHTQRERGEISPEEFHRVQDLVVEEVLREQAAAGVELVTDGQIRWHDPISHLAGPLEGVEINGLLRLFDTNFYFRQPVVRGTLCWRGPVVAGEYAFARDRSPVPVKPVLTGPYTLARASLLADGSYAGTAALTLAYAEAVAAEVAALVEAGASIIQVDEPAILRHPQDLAVATRGLEVVAARKGAARLALYTYFGDAAPLYEGLQALPVDILGLDFTYSPALAEVVRSAGTAKALGLGLIDGRNTRLERPEDVLPVLDRVRPAVGLGPSFLNPSCGLEFLPRDRAREKLTNMKALRDRYLGGGRS